MKLVFNIEYQTVFGEELILNLMTRDVQGASLESAYRMSTIDGYHWFYEMRGKFNVGNVIDYYYSVECNGMQSRHEWLIAPHRLELVSNNGTNYMIYDHWIDIPEDSYLYSSAFTDCIARHTPVKSALKPFVSTVRLKVRAPQLRECERLAVVGEDPLLGGWEILKTAFNLIIDAVKNVGRQMRGLGDIIQGVMTFDVDKIKQGWNEITSSVGKYVRESLGDIRSAGANMGQALVDGLNQAARGHLNFLDTNSVGGANTADGYGGMAGSGGSVANPTQAKDPAAEKARKEAERAAEKTEVY